MASKVNPDLQKERNTATFPVHEMTYLLDGGRKNTFRRRELENIALSDPVYQHKSVCFLSRDEKYALALKKALHAVNKARELGLTSPADLYYYKRMAMPHESNGVSLHTGMYLPTLYNQCTDEQKEKWLQRSLNYEIIGTYAQTELGHGTFIRGLETTATYDPRTEEFVLNTPTITATKWWPGNLGKSTNHAVVLATLIVNGKKCGMQSFMLQTRSLEDHQPMPGVTLGDIGPKFGYDSNDNGFMRLDNVRIPRENMLMKNAEVTKDGQFISKGHPKSGYLTMVFVRSGITGECARSLAQCCTITTRYSAIRRQSEMTPGEPEPQILDYQTQQYKIFPWIATSYALWFSGDVVRDLYFRYINQLDKGDHGELPELHAVSAGLKAFSSWQANEGIEVLRMACGGHGYSQASGIPKIYVDITPACTYEGENTVMMLQVARYLVKCYTKSMQGKKLTGFAAYLQDKTFPKCLLGEDCSLDTLEAAYRHRAARLVTLAVSKLQSLMSSGQPQEKAWNGSSVELVRAATAHTHYFVVKTNIEVIKKIVNPALLEMKNVLTSLCQLYCLYGIAENSGDFLEDGYMSGAQLGIARNKMLALLAEIRPNAVALVDSYDFHDRILDSVLGRFDGQVYENLYKWAQDSPFNETQVLTESYNKYLRPVIRGNLSKL